MPLDSSIVGGTIAPLEHTVDARWLMAYAASLNDYNPRYLETDAHTVIGHPVFPVCVEWPVILNMREVAGTQSLTQEEAVRGVHAAHDLHIYRPIQDGDVLTTSATMVGVRSIRPGAAYTMRLDTLDQNGELVARTYQLGIYRGVSVDGGDRQSEEIPALPTWETPPSTTTAIPIAAGAAHTYTECARIWNPIHTDRKVALAAGLPDIILHGTATLAYAVSHLVNEFAGGDPGRVMRLGGRFAAMVLMPSDIRVAATNNNGTVSFTVFNEQGEEAISGGFLCIRN